MARVAQTYLCLACGNPLTVIAKHKEHSTYECCYEHCAEKGKMLKIFHVFTLGTRML